MPLPKRKRIFTPKRKTKHSILKEQAKLTQSVENEVTMARGRLKGALLEALEPTAEDSDVSFESSPVKTRESKLSNEHSDESSAEEEVIPKSPPRQSYVLKLFDRSVDLSQFMEDSPLYPICRAWIANKPKANYRDIGRQKLPETIEDGIDLPGPDGPQISRIPDLIPAQQESNKSKINLNYREAPPPSRDTLLRGHLTRWADVRSAWLERAALVEARYASSQEVLNSLNVSGP